ncbi:MAG: hypothetical protein Q9170_002254 [Blastenia crenularia]
MAEGNGKFTLERLSFLTWEDGTPVPMTRTDAQIARWLDSDDCTLEAVGWKPPLHNQPIEQAPLPDIPLYSRPGRWPPPEVLQLERASAAGDLTQVKTILQQWRERPEDQQINLGLFASSFKFAMDAGDVSIGSYMLDFGVSMNEAHFNIAIEKKSYSFLELFLAHGFDINFRRGRSNPGPLADTFEDEVMTQWFLDHGADPNAESKMNVTPISRAVVYASMDIIELLFNHGGPHSIDHGQLLHHAVQRDKTDRLQVLEFLFTKGARRDIDQLKYHDRPDCFEMENLIIGCGTPLHEAARLGKQDIVEFLVANGANFSMRDGKGFLAVDRARQEGQSKVVEYLNSLSTRSVL